MGEEVKVLVLWTQETKGKIMCCKPLERHSLAQRTSLKALLQASRGDIGLDLLKDSTVKSMDSYSDLGRIWAVVLSAFAELRLK